MTKRQNFSLQPGEARTGKSGFLILRGPEGAQFVIDEPALRHAISTPIENRLEGQPLGRACLPVCQREFALREKPRSVRLAISAFEARIEQDEGQLALLSK